jgi:hypothetical protein
MEQTPIMQYSDFSFSSRFFQNVFGRFFRFDAGLQEISSPQKVHAVNLVGKNLKDDLDFGQLKRKRILRGQ